MGEAQKLVLGTANFGLDYGLYNADGQLGRAQVKEILKAASLLGVDMIDTAAAYGNSETVLGDLQPSFAEIVTKTSGQGGAVYEELKSSLKRLDRERVYALLLHRPENLLLPDGLELARGLKRIKDEGLAAKVGFSIYDPYVLGDLCEVLRPDLVQMPFNVFDQRIVSSGWAERLRDQDVELHARSMFLQGLLANDAQRRPTKFARWQGLFDEWDAYVRDTGASAAMAAASQAMSCPFIDRFVVGVDSVAQLTLLAKPLENLPELPILLRKGVDEPLLINPSEWGKL